MRDSHRPGRARDRPRLRPTRNRPPPGRPDPTPATRPATRPRPDTPPGHSERPTRVHVHGRPPARPAPWVRDLAAGHRDPRTARPDRLTGTDRHLPVRPPARGPRPRSGRHAPAPVPGPARHLHRPDLPGGPPPSATSNTTHPTRQAAAPACVTAVLSAGMTTGPNRIPGGQWNSPNRRSSGGKPRRDGSTPTNRPGTRSEPGLGQASRTWPARWTTGASQLQGKLIQRSVRFQT